MKKIFLLIFLVILLLVVSINSKKATSEPNSVVSAAVTSSESPQVIANNLTIPWSIDFLPDNSIIFTERPGRVRLITSTGALLETPLLTLKSVKAIGEGGLLGLAVHPKYSINKYVYLYYTYSSQGDNTKNKVSRFTMVDKTLENETEIVNNIPGNVNHNGGRIKFGPDGFLYITTGDSQYPSLSQNTSSLAGKILRVTDTGRPAPDNPYKNLIFSYGHRNPQGLTWDGQGRLWSTEHGPSANDELNLIIKGTNYGWPSITGASTAYGMKSPVINSGRSTWAPSGLVFYENNLFFAGLRGNALFKYNMSSGGNSTTQYLSNKYGRLRDIVLGPDGYFYISTSNLDGRSLTHLDGDKIIKIHPRDLH